MFRFSRHPSPPAILAAGLLVCASLACQKEAPKPEKTLRPVKSAVVEMAAGTLPFTYAGVARAGVESQLSFRVDGSVQKVLVELGDRVEEGQLLVRLDPTDYELRVEEAEAALAQGQAALRRAQADYARVRKLYENNNAAKSELDAARAGAESGEAQVQAIRKQLSQARKFFDYTRLTAPQAGVVAQIRVEVNENVRAGQPVLLLTSGSRPEVSVGVPESMIDRVVRGQTVDVEFDSLPGEIFKAEVKEFAAAASQSSTYEVIALLSEDLERVRSGMAADVTFQFSNPAGSRVFVPPVAVGEDSSGRFVFLLEGSGGVGRVVRRAVEIGDLTAEGLEIRSGISAGDRVVTAGVRRLSDGMEVKLVEGDLS